MNEVVWRRKSEGEMLEDSKKDDFHIGKYNFKSWLKSFFVGIKVRLGIIRLGVSGSAVAIICKL